MSHRVLLEPKAVLLFLTFVFYAPSMPGIELAPDLGVWMVPRGPSSWAFEGSASGCPSRVLQVLTE